MLYLNYCLLNTVFDSLLYLCPGATSDQLPGEAAVDFLIFSVAPTDKWKVKGPPIVDLLSWY